MPSYRCYFVDGRESYWDTCKIEADTVESAIKEALSALPRKPRCTRIEIWDETQVVYRRGKEAGGPSPSRRDPLAKSFKILVARCFGRPEISQGH
ncbi:MAG TPA: hypothetical protein VKZ79_08785 [Alphaproteobacteria bacterium]|nr:hypothetical protein [Alphaproteobacteria bacterium]